MKPEEVIENATKLQTERFAKRNALLKQRSAERYNETKIKVPDAYATTAEQHSSNIINDEVRQIATLVFAMPVPHLVPPSPEDQPLTTKVEQFLAAMHQELQDHYGPVWEQCTEAAVDDRLGWIYFAPKRKPYRGAPKPAADDADEDEKYESGRKIERYKKDAGIAALFDYEYAATETVFYDGNVYNPQCVYVIKEVPASTFKKTYGEMENVTGRTEQTSETTVKVVEYWDRDDCIIVAETKDSRWLGMRQVRGSQLLDSWTHGWGRVPYFARPAFVTKELGEDKKYASPVDGIYNEMPSHKRLRTMMDAVAYQTAFSPMKITTKETGETILDDSGNPLLYVKPKPGEAIQMRPGQDIGPIGQSPEVGVLAQEVMASQQRIERFTLSPVAKGVSPGADTANAALSNLHRFQLSTLDPMADQTARQGRSLYRFALERIRDGGEAVYVLDAETDRYLSLAPEEIVSVNVQVKATPDQGQQQLLIEKHAMELWMAGAITETEFHEMRGKENPEEYVLANAAERLLKMIEPISMQQLITDYGMLNAMEAMAEANAQGRPSRTAVPQLMERARQMNGMGQGSPGQPRMPGVRMPTDDVNTQEMMANGV